MEIKEIDLKNLKSAPYNPRKINDKALSGLSESLKKFGILQPIIYNKRTGFVVGGHQRLKALEMQGVQKTNCIVVDFDEITEKAANIALNNQYISGEWNAEILEPLIKDLNVNLEEFDKLNFDDLMKDFDFKEINNNFFDEEEKKINKRLIKCPKCSFEFEK